MVLWHAAVRPERLQLLLPMQTSIEEMIASTAYLDLFLRSVSETALLKTFLRFVLLHRHDNATILDTLVSRINSNSRVSGGAGRAGTQACSCLMSPPSPALHGVPEPLPDAAQSQL